MRFRLLERLVPSPRAQRRLQRIGGAVLLGVGYPFRLLFGLAKAIGQIVAAWWESRNLRFLLQGLPALVLMIGLMVLGVMLFFQDRAALAQEYETQGVRALAESRQRANAAQDAKAPVALAQMCYKRLSPLGKAENTFHMAESYELQRQFPAAEMIYLSLAPTKYEIKFPGPGEGQVSEIRSRPGATIKPEDIVAVVTTGTGNVEVRAETYGKIIDVPVKTGETVRGGQVLALLGRGYGPAHYKVAIKLLRSNPNSSFAAEYHLVRAYEYSGPTAEPYASLARAALFDVLRDTNRPDEAEEQMVKAVGKIGDQDPQLRMKLAEWYYRTGKRDQAEEQVKRVVDTLGKRVDENVNDFESRAQLIDSLKFAGGLKCARGDFKKGKEDFARSRAYCQRGMAMTTDPVLQQRYLTFFCYMFLAQFDGTLNDPNTTWPERFALLETALGLRPNDINLIQRLGLFVQQSGPESDKARAALQKMIDEGRHLSLAHMILGTAAWEKHDVATAQYHWEKAFEQTDWSPLVANNLAWLLAFHNKPPDLERALMLVGAALQKQDMPQFHGTRGHILAELGRNREALPELEAAKSAYVNNPKEAQQLFKRLAQVTKALGMEGESKRYDKLADDLLKAATPAGGPAGPAAVPEPKTPAGAPAPAADAKAPAAAPKP